MTPLISVVIPTRSRPMLLCRALDSVLCQSFKDFEVVIVIDGEDPDTLAVLERYDDERITAHALPTSVGGSGARNEGVQRASGKWIAFLDDDDEWFPDKLERQLAAAKRLDAPFPVVGSRFIARAPHCDYLWPARLPDLYEPLSEYLFVRKSLYFGEGLLQTSTLFASRALLLKVPFTTGLKKHQDWDWVLRVAQIDEAVFDIIPEPLAIWHIENERQSVSNESTWRFSLEWIQHNRHLVTKKAYAAFIATQVGPQAARQAEWKVFRMLLKEMFRYGEPRVVDLITYLAMWGIRQNLRRRIRAVFTSLKN